MSETTQQADRRLPGRIIAWLLATLVLPGLGFAESLSDSGPGRRVLVDMMVGVARQVAWPESAFASSDARIVVCLLGPDPFEGKLPTMLGRSEVDGRSLAVRLLPMNPALADQTVPGMERCHLVYIATSLKPRTKEILDRLDNLIVLSISDMDGFASAGGMVGLVGSGNRVALQINRTALDDSGLTVSPALLSLGR